MRDWEKEYTGRVEFIRELVRSAGVKGIVYGNSGGKDCTLVGILCKAACDNTLGILMPCGTSVNYGKDTEDALAAAAQYCIEQRVVDITATRDALSSALGGSETLNNSALINIPPRLRMTTLYAVAAAEGMLVASTGNRSERYMGYYTKWGDGAGDFDPIADLTATEVFAFLDWLKAPLSIRTKAPSAGLFEGQTDEDEMGVTYAAIDRYLEGGEVTDAERTIIERYHRNSEHKRVGVKVYKDID